MPRLAGARRSAGRGSAGRAAAGRGAARSGAGIPVGHFLTVIRKTGCWGAVASGSSSVESALTSPKKRPTSQPHRTAWTSSRRRGGWPRNWPRICRRRWSWCWSGRGRGCTGWWASTTRSPADSSSALVAVSMGASLPDGGGSKPSHFSADEGTKGRPYGPERVAPAGRACPGRWANGPFGHGMVGTGSPSDRQGAVLIGLSRSSSPSMPSHVSHSAMLRAIGWPVSISTKPNCPDWLHSRNHQTPSASSTKSKAP